MTELKYYIGRIETELSTLNLSNEPANLYDPIHYFFRLGGKRLRPALTLMTADLFGALSENAMHAALSIELFHNFSLIHDDIMDESSVRRGKETIHQKWNKNIAILSGDALLVKAYESLAKCDARFLTDLLNLFNKTATEVCEGQQMDMDFEEKENVSEVEYIEMIRLKTSVLLGCAMKFGGIVAELDKKIQDSLFNFGQYIGIAFQIKDDLLDLYGESEKVGKQIGGDVINNKKTLLNIKARDFGCDVISINTIEDITIRIKKAQTLFESSGAKIYVEQRMHEFYNMAIDSLNSIPEKQRSYFNSFASLVINRNF